jgi:hypothetical protein
MNFVNFKFFLVGIANKRQKWLLIYNDFFIWWIWLIHCLSAQVLKKDRRVMQFLGIILAGLLSPSVLEKIHRLNLHNTLCLCRDSRPAGRIKAGIKVSGDILLQCVQQGFGLGLLFKLPCISVRAFVDKKALSVSENSKKMDI